MIFLSLESAAELLERNARAEGTLCVLAMQEIQQEHLAAALEGKDVSWTE